MSIDESGEGPPLAVRVFVRDEIVRLGLTAVLSALPVVGDVGQCATWADVVDVVRTAAADVVILGETPGALPADRDTKVLVLVRDHQHVDDLLTGTVAPDGFLVQGEITVTTLADALRRITRGEIPIPALVARALMERMGTTPPVRRNRASLTARETETLALLGEGLSNKQIARRLCISSHGAKRIVASLLVKLDSPNRTMAVVTAINLGLIKTS